MHKKLKKIIKSAEDKVHSEKDEKHMKSKGACDVKMKKK